MYITVEPAMPRTHLGGLYTFNFSIQLKSLQGLIATIVGYVAVRTLHLADRPLGFVIAVFGLTAEILPPRGQK